MIKGTIASEEARRLDRACLKGDNPTVLAILVLRATLIVSVAALVIAGGVASAAERVPPGCEQAAKFMHEHPNIKVTCGHAVVIARGKRHNIDGICWSPQTAGVAGETESLRMLGFGVTTPRAVPHKGLFLMLEPGNRPGRVRIIDGQLDLVPGIRVALSGTAVVDRGLRSGTFWVYGRVWANIPSGGRFTGSWTCSPTPRTSGRPNDD